jgi:hypothetical protein
VDWQQKRNSSRPRTKLKILEVLESSEGKLVLFYHVYEDFVLESLFVQSPVFGVPPCRVYRY